MTSRTIIAIVGSLLIHGIFALALIAYLEYAPEPDVLATLDLSSVELSFAEKVEEAAAIAPMPPTAERRVPLPPQDEKPPEAKREKPHPQDVGEIKFPEPKEDARLKTEDAKDARRETEDAKDVRRETEDTKDARRETEVAKSVNSPAAAPRQARVDAPPRPKRNIRPEYPKGARQRGEQGDVVLEIRVNASGTVDEVKIVGSSGYHELDEAAAKAARGAKFAPARSGHESVASTARLKLTFKLR